MTFKDKALQAIGNVRRFQQVCARERFSPRPLTHQDETLDSFVATESSVSRAHYPFELMELWKETEREALGR